MYANDIIQSFLCNAKMMVKIYVNSEDDELNGLDYSKKHYEPAYTAGELRAGT